MASFSQSSRQGKVADLVHATFSRRRHQVSRPNATTKPGSPAPTLEFERLRAELLSISCEVQRDAHSCESDRCAELLDPSAVVIHLHDVSAVREALGYPMLNTTASVATGTPSGASGSYRPCA
jgi:hypothetical protein